MTLSWRAYGINMILAGCHCQQPTLWGAFWSCGKRTSCSALTILWAKLLCYVYLLTIPIEILGFFSRVYCRGNTSNRNLLCAELLHCQDQWGMNDVVGGDFNMVLKHNEKSGNQFSISCAQNFQENIDNLGLEDLPLNGGRWTWSNHRDTPAFSCIDRFLVSMNLLLTLPG